MGRGTHGIRCSRGTRERPRPARRGTHLGRRAGRRGAGDPVVILLPALGVAAGYYGPFAAALAAEGVAVLAADFPGQGVSRPLASRSNDFGYAAVSDHVVAATVAVARERHAGRPLAFLGHSFGGQVAMVHLATHDSPVRALVLIGSGSPYWRGFPQRLKLLAQTQTLGAVAALRGHWPGDRVGFGGRQPRQLMREWARFARRGDLAVEREDTVAEPDFAGVDLPVLAITLDNDPLAPQGSVDNLAAKLTGSCGRAPVRDTARRGGRPGVRPLRVGPSPGRVRRRGRRLVARGRRRELTGGHRSRAGEWSCTCLMWRVTRGLLDVSRAAGRPRACI